MRGSGRWRNNRVRSEHHGPRMGSLVGHHSHVLSLQLHPVQRERHQWPAGVFFTMEAAHPQVVRDQRRASARPWMRHQPGRCSARMGAAQGRTGEGVAVTTIEEKRVRDEPNDEPRLPKRRYIYDGRGGLTRAEKAERADRQSRLALYLISLRRP